MKNFKIKLLSTFVLLSSLFFVAQSAFAVVTISEPTADVASGTDSNTYSFASFTPAANSILIVFVAASGTVQADPTVTDGVNSWTLEASQNYNTTATLYMFWTKAANSLVTITFTAASDQPNGAAMAILEVAGGDVVTLNPIRQRKPTSGGASDPVISMDLAFVVTNGAICGPSASRNPAAWVPPVSPAWVETADTGHTSPTNGLEAAYVVGETGTTVTYTGTDGNWGAICAEVYASGAGPAPPAPGEVYDPMGMSGFFGL